MAKYDEGYPMLHRSLGRLKRGNPPACCNPLMARRDGKEWMLRPARKTKRSLGPAIVAMVCAILIPIKPVFSLENAPQAVPFELKQVRLLDGPFKAAQQIDATYL